jgi:hypothetical protein
MRIPIVGAAVGTAVVAGGAAAIALSAHGAPAVANVAVQLASASSPANAADQAAVSYVAQHFAGSGIASVLKTEADTEHGMPVYDVRIKAPNGAVYSLSVRSSNDSIMSAHLAETSPAPSSTPGESGPSSSPTPIQRAEPQQTPEPTTSAVEPLQSQSPAIPKGEAQGSPEQQPSGPATKADG